MGSSRLCFKECEVLEGRTLVCLCVCVCGFFCFLGEFLHPAELFIIIEITF
jgi:hypothetical protein